MQFTIVSILALATAALSMPAGQEKRDDHARADLCTSSNHGGYCINFGLLPYGKSHCCRKIHPFSHWQLLTLLEQGTSRAISINSMTPCHPSILVMALPGLFTRKTSLSLIRLLLSIIKGSWVQRQVA
jgi:hypothetical protein